MTLHERSVDGQIILVQRFSNRYKQSQGGNVRVTGGTVCTRNQFVNVKAAALLDDAPN